MPSTPDQNGSVQLAGSIVCGDAPVRLLLNATDVRFDFARGTDGHPALVWDTACEATAEAAIRHNDLERTALALARKLAAENGATVESVSIKLTTDTPQSVRLEAEVSATMMMSATIRVSGRIGIDDALNATVSQLACDGSGMINAMAAGVLRPKLMQLEGRSFPLGRPLPGGMRLRDLKIETGETVRVQARLEPDARP